MHKRGRDLFPKDPKLAERIDYIIAQITQAVDVSKIVLFGSYARGDFDPEYSEIDIIIIANTNKKFLDRIRMIREICEGFPSVNPLIYTKEEYRELLKEGEGFLEDALEEGKVIYEKI